jgi:PAS domain S-box-containing protein
MLHGAQLPPSPHSDLVLPQSETAALLKSTDWASTPLGPLKRWPQSLRIAVGICLNSRFPMFVWWGRELINIYNDAYIPVLGKRHPAAFGRPAKSAWEEIWPVVGPQAETVMQRGEATWNERVLLVMERHGYTEDTWFTWSYSPIPDENGTIGGLFCACTEDTPRVLAERERDLLLAQKESEYGRLAEVFAQSPAFLAVLRGPQHVIEFTNERYRDLIGRRDVVGKTVREAFPEIAGQGFFEILDRVYSSGEPFVGTAARMVLQRRAGLPPEEAYLDFVYQPLRGADGAVAGILSHGVDVTEPKRAERRDSFLLALDDALRPLVDPATITATGARLLGEHLQADRCAYADVEEDEDTFNLLGDYNRGVPSIVGRYRFADFGAEVLRLMREDEPYIVTDVETHQPDIGDLTYYRQTMIRAVICVPLHKGGRFVAAMAVHQKTPRTWRSEDVELLQAVASRCWESIERVRVTRTLRESEARFRQLADAMPQIVFAATAEGHVDYFNRQWYEYTGQSPGAVGFESWQQVHTEEGLRRTAERWAEAVRTGQPYEIEYALRRRDGEYRWHLGRALPIRDDQGRIVRWFGTNTDIHERKQFEQSLQEARAEAEHASRMKDEFLATLSHELRTPLNAILGWAQILKMKASLPPELAQGVEVIERNARAQGTIIADLLDMSAIVSGKVRLELENTDATLLVRGAVETARPAAAAKQIRLEVDLVPVAPLVADANRVQQVLWNLLSNAVKFTPQGGRIRVEGRLEKDDGAHCFVLRVSDTGEGIDPDFLPHLFDRFRQADASTTRRHAGLGLGLSIVKQLVELHGGAIRAHSGGSGLGATFTVTLPQVPREPVETLAQGKAPLLTPSGGEIAGLQILVVDDELDARNLVKRILEDCNASVTTAASAAEATELVRRSRFDVLVSDIGMPGEDGHSLLRKLRSLGPEQGGDIPAIALSAYARAEDRVRAVRAGFQVHLAKPVEPAELIAMVASVGKRF